MKPVVLHLITSLRGGPGRLLHDILSDEKAHIQYDHVICSMYEPDPFLVSSLNRWSIKIKDLHLSSFLDVHTIPVLVRLINNLKPQILHTWLFRADFYGQTIGNILNIPVRVASILNNDDIAVKEDYGIFFAKLLIVLYRWIAHCSNGFIASSKEVANYLEHRGIRPRKLIVAHNMINTSLFLQNDSAVRERVRSLFGFRTEHIVIGSASVFHKRKGLHVLIAIADKVIESFPNVRFFLAGDGPTKSELESIVKQSDIMKGKVIFPGTINDMKEFLDSIDIYVQPALCEGLPLAVLQAMAAGKPIVATRVGGIPEAISNGIEGILVIPRDTQSLFKGLIKLIDDQQLCKILGNNARNRVMKYFDSKILTDKIISFYNSIYSKQIIN